MTPYAASLLPILQHYLTASHAELLPCRCHATECAGLVLEGLGAAAQAGSAEARALLAASVPGFMQQALQVSALSTTIYDIYMVYTYHIYIWDIYMV